MSASRFLLHRGQLGCSLREFAERQGFHGPMRAPHHTCSVVGVMGAFRRRPDKVPQLLYHPGEVSLAHHGVLVLDDLPEFQVRVIQEVSCAFREQRIKLRLDGEWVEIRTPFDVLAVAASCPCGVPELCACSTGHRSLFESRIRRFANMFRDTTVDVTP